MANNHSETERRLWDAADEFRANSDLKSSEYATPVLGLIFLRYADHRFIQVEKELKGKSKTIDAARVKEIFRSRPVLKNLITDPGFPTLESIVIELIPGNPRVHIAPGPPDSNKYSTFDFEKGFVETEN